MLKLFRMQRHDWSSTSTLHLSLSPCTGYQLQLVSSLRHWWLHIEQPQAQHPPTSTHYYKSTSPPEVWDQWAMPRGTITERLKITLQNILVHRSWLVEWSSHPHPECLNPCQSSSNNWKLISFNTTWLHHKNNNNKKKILPFFYIFIFLFIFLSFPC